MDPPGLTDSEDEEESEGETENEQSSWHPTAHHQHSPDISPHPTDLGVTQCDGGLVQNGNL